jgi:steroid delta-isomerase
MLPRLILLAPLVAFGACAAPPPPPVAPAPVLSLPLEGGDTVIIDALRNHWVVAANQLDLSAVAISYTPDAVMVVSDGTTLRGANAIQERWGRYAPTNGSSSYTTTDLSIADNLAFETGLFTVQVTPGTGAGYRVTGRYNTVYTRQPDGGWRIRSQLFSAEPPAPPAAGAASRWTVENTLARYFGAIRASNSQAWAGTFADGALVYDVTGDPAQPARIGLRQFFTGHRGTFESLSLTEDDVVIAGDKVAVKWTGRGAGKNGREVRFEGVNVFEIGPEGKIRLAWSYWNPDAVIDQLQANAR